MPSCFWRMAVEVDEVTTKEARVMLIAFAVKILKIAPVTGFTFAPEAPVVAVPFFQVDAIPNAFPSNTMLLITRTLSAVYPDSTVNSPVDPAALFTLAIKLLATLLMTLE